MPRSLRCILSVFVVAFCFTLVTAQDEIDESKLKVPDDAKDQMKYIERKWDSSREKEQLTVEVCLRRLKESVPGDEDLTKKFVKSFTGFKERCADELYVDLLKKAKVTDKLLRREFEKLREGAVAAIEDVNYTERDKNKLQPEVDKACEPVFKIWRDPMGYCIENKELDMAQAAEIDELVKRLGEIEASVADWGEDIEDCTAYIKKKGNEYLDVTHVEYKAQKEWLDKNEAIEVEGLTEEDREHVRIVNDYRLMLGRKMLMIHPQLCDACRRHAEWMAKNNKLGHYYPDHPDGADQNDRALKAGFRGKVYENVTIAKGADAAVWRMYKAAEHHRNMVRGSHNTIGVGHSGDYWCQNFSPDES